MTNQYIDHYGPLGENHESLGDGNFRHRAAGDPDQAGSRGFSRSQVSPMADAWADSGNLRPIQDKFRYNHADLTAAHHEAAVKEFLDKGGKVIKLDRGASSGLVLEPKRSNIRYGKGKEPFIK